MEIKKKSFSTENACACIYQHSEGCDLRCFFKICAVLLSCCEKHEITACANGKSLSKALMNIQ